MTETEKKALALVNEACKADFKDLGSTYRNNLLDALLLAIAQHEAFKREVSEVCRHLPNRPFVLDRFIIAKPDPLVEALAICLGRQSGQGEADDLRAALAARGLEVREIEGGA